MNIANVLDAWEAWWTRQNDQPIIHAIFQQGEYEEVLPWKKDWMSPTLTKGWSAYNHEQLFGRALELHLKTGEDRYLTEIIEYQARVARLIGHAGEGYSFIHPGFGPSCLAGFISGQARFHDTTIWFGRESSCTWEEIEGMFAGTNAYAEAARRWLPELIRGVQEHYVIAMPDFGDGLDPLSALRRPEDIMFDTYDDPERVKRAIEQVHRCWEEHDRWARELIAPGNHGAHADVMRYLSREPNQLVYCDCAAMISPEMFAEFVMPTLLRQCARYPGRSIFHLDGPRMIPHLDLICSIPSLHAVQWVYGAGNPPGTRSDMGRPLHPHPRPRQADQPLRRAARRRGHQRIFLPLPESRV
jgi:hypothetical protein